MPNKRTLLNRAEAKPTSSSTLRSNQKTSTGGAHNMFDGINTQKGTATDFDWRARLRPKLGGRDLFWQGALEIETGSDQNRRGKGVPIDYLLRPLYESGGLVWQYTPTLFYAGTANYNQQSFHGTNYPLNTYINSEPPELPLISDFTANTIDEARYLLGVMHFCKIATKSFFGDIAVKDGLYGTPPPVLLFEYLGEHGFNKVPVIVTQYTVNLQDDVDYIPVETSTGGDTTNVETTYVPTKVNIALTLRPNYTPHKLRKRFDLRSFTSGKDYGKGFI
jgi:hypothetical protein